ncbi:MAG: DUF3299 domain-containing protein [Aquisalinus sp.]|nr:DUF3299 domain-containing protein [Aquisalinus sp.]
MISTVLARAAFLLGILLPALSVSGCSGLQPDKLEVQQFDPSVLRGGQDISSLAWDDLLPEGEERIIARLQDEYLDDLARQLTTLQPRTLAEAGRADAFAEVEEGSALDFMPQLGTFNVVSELHDLKVRIPGFIVPLQSQGTNLYTEFLLVPYFGACIHLPPPPPNQIIYVMSDVAVHVEDTGRAYFLEGLLQTDKMETELGNTAYTLKLDNIMFYVE